MLHSARAFGPRVAADSPQWEQVTGHGRQIGTLTERLSVLGMTVGESRATRNSKEFKHLARFYWFIGEVD